MIPTKRLVAAWKGLCSGDNTQTAARILESDLADFEKNILSLQSYRNGLELYNRFSKKGLHNDAQTTLDDCNLRNVQDLEQIVKYLSEAVDLQRANIIDGPAEERKKQIRDIIAKANALFIQEKRAPDLEEPAP